MFRRVTHGMNGEANTGDGQYCPMSFTEWHTIVVDQGDFVVTHEPAIYQSWAQTLP